MDRLDLANKGWERLWQPISAQGDKPRRAIVAWYLYAGSTRGWLEQVRGRRLTGQLTLVDGAERLPNSVSHLRFSARKSPAARTWCLLTARVYE